MLQESLGELAAKAQMTASADGGETFPRWGGVRSPGRWPHHARSYADGPQWEWLRKRTLELVLAVRDFVALWMG